MLYFMNTIKQVYRDSRESIRWIKGRYNWGTIDMPQIFIFIYFKTDIYRSTTKFVTHLGHLINDFTDAFRHSMSGGTMETYR